MSVSCYIMCWSCPDWTIGCHENNKRTTSNDLFPEILSKPLTNTPIGWAGTSHFYFLHDNDELSVHQLTDDLTFRSNPDDAGRTFQSCDNRVCVNAVRGAPLCLPGTVCCGQQEMKRLRQRSPCYPATLSVFGWRCTAAEHPCVQASAMPHQAAAAAVWCKQPERLTHDEKCHNRPVRLTPCCKQTRGPCSIYAADTITNHPDLQPSSAIMNPEHQRSGWTDLHSVLSHLAKHVTFITAAVALCQTP